jgi:hypothetical protein
VEQHNDYKSGQGTKLTRQSYTVPVLIGKTNNLAAVVHRALQCLLPFLNSPLIAWTLESLSAAKVKIAWIVIRDGAKELQEWLECVVIPIALQRLSGFMLVTTVTLSITTFVHTALPHSCLPQHL